MFLSTILFKNSILQPQHGAHEEEIPLGKASFSHILTVLSAPTFGCFSRRLVKAKVWGENHLSDSLLARWNTARLYVCVLIPQSSQNP